MTKRELQQILAKAKNERRGGAPHENWISQNRDILLMQVRNTIDRKSRPSVLDGARHFVSVFLPPQSVMAAARSFAVFLMVMGTVFGGGLISVVAYRDAAPGEAIYKMKLAVEKVQVALAPNDAYQVRLHAEFADRRLEEAAKLAEGPADSRRLAVSVLEDFNEELVQLKSGLLRLNSVDPHGVAVSAKLLDRKMAMYQQALRGIVRNLPADVRPSALAVSERVQGLSLQATAVLVEQHLAGNVDASKSAITNQISDRLGQAEASLTLAAEKKPESDGRQEKAKLAINEARSLLAEENYQAAFSKMVEVVELTKEVETEVVTEEAEAAKAEMAGDSDSEGEEGQTEDSEDSVEAETDSGDQTSNGDEGVEAGSGGAASSETETNTSQE